MDFTGRIFFDFESFDVWRIYQTALKASRDATVSVNVTWEEFLVKDIDRETRIPSKVRALGACAAVRDAHPEAWQRFNLTLLTLIFQEKDDPRKDATLAVAANVAGIDPDEVIARAIDPGLELLIASTDAARKLGVSDVPAVVSNGPPVHIKTTAAANYGNSVYRLDLINRMLRDDGIWSLTKP
jgi:predicted DsbA family dithiol-disulfide isomerase